MTSFTCYYYSQKSLFVLIPDVVIFFMVACLGAFNIQNIDDKLLVNLWILWELCHRLMELCIFTSSIQPYTESDLDDEYNRGCYRCLFYVGMENIIMSILYFIYTINIYTIFFMAISSYKVCKVLYFKYRFNKDKNKVNKFLKSIKVEIMIDESCIICYENLSKCACKLKCDHIFHEYCIEKWIKQKNGVATCPICRDPIVLFVSKC